jgi:sugar phosphate isomerase/epimerase
MMERRGFLALGLGAPLLRGAPFDKPLGINLYTVRDVLAKEPEKTYRALAALGIARIEVRANHLRDHAGFIRAAGLQPVHMFIDSALLAPDRAAALQEAAAQAKEFGIQRLGLSYLMPAERAGAIERINQTVDMLGGLGLGFYYHNHAWEFDDAAGASFMERLRREAHPELTLELDLFWATVGGAEVTALLRQWTGRVASLHVKDVAADAPRQKTEANIPRTAFKEVGAGILDWPRVLQAAAAAGVEEYLIEQDFTPGDPLASVRQSVEFLRRVEVG